MINRRELLNAALRASAIIGPIIVTLAMVTHVLRKNVLSSDDLTTLIPLVFVAGLARCQWKRSEDRETAFVSVRIRPDDLEEEKVAFDVFSLVAVIGIAGFAVYSVLPL